MPRRKILSGITSSLALAGLLALALSLNIWALGVQDTSRIKEKVIQKLYLEDSPVVVVDLKVSGKSHKLGDKFDDDENWLNHFSLRLKNVSPKPIIFIELYLDFPETKATGNVMAFPIRFGINPRARVPFGEAKRLAPQETVDIALSQVDYSKLKTFLEQRHPIASINKASIRITEVYFADGAIWSNGSWVRPDPNNLNRLIPVDTP
jgi:hypothetical protein